jgi:alpha-L-fucosidase 2
MYWDYYLYTDDTKFLKTRALPFMRDVALFYEEFLKVKGDGLYESSPSYSPHSTPANFIETDLQIARNASIDFAVARELLHNLITGSQATKTNQSEIAKWSDMLTRIPKVEIADNIVREYLEPKLQDNLSSPSTAVFYPVYPSIDTSPIGDNQEHLKQYINTAKKRLLQSAHNTNSVQLLKYSAILARLHESSLSYDTLNLAIKNMTMSNLIMTHNDWRGMGVGAQDIWATYTTEANSLVSAVLQEMVLQSDNNTIAILPALPQDWVRGSVACMLARNGAEISIDWDYKKGNISLSIKGRKAGVVNIIFPQEVKKIRAIGAEKIDYVTRKVSDLMLPAGKVVTIEMKL